MRPSRDSSLVLGCDFGCPVDPAQQARKIVLIEAVQRGLRQYAIVPDGRNQRLLERKRPGWTVAELATSLESERSAAVVGFDFPFSIPLELLGSGEFGAAVGVRPFAERANWVRFVKQRLDLQNLDFAEFELWRDKRFWVKRETDRAASAQAPLKHMFQNLFNMTVAGSVLLDRLQEAGWTLGLNPFEMTPVPERVAVEAYPGKTARVAGFTGSYKQQPEMCLGAAERFLENAGIRLEFDPRIRKFATTYRSSPGDPDGADAFLCLVVAICVREGMAEWWHGGASASRLIQEGCIVTPARRSLQ